MQEEKKLVDSRTALGQKTIIVVRAERDFRHQNWGQASLVPALETFWGEGVRVALSIIRESSDHAFSSFEPGLNLVWKVFKPISS